MSNVNMTDSRWPNEYEQKIWTWPKTDNNEKFTWWTWLKFKINIATTTNMSGWIRQKIENTINIATTTNMSGWIWPEIENTILLCLLVFHTVTVIIGLTTQIEWEHPFYNIWEQVWLKENSRPKNLALSTHNREQN